MSSFSDVVRKYEAGSNKIKKMYMDGGESISGCFKNESLEIEINGIDDRYLKDILFDLKKYISKLDENELIRKKDMSVLINVPGVNQWLKYYQALSHESFHLLQSLTLQAVSEYVYWIRQFHDFEFMVFAMNLSSDKGYWDVSDGETTIFDAIERISDPDFRNGIKNIIERNGARHQELYESYIENTHGISVVELVEGTAIAFQELVTHSVGKNIHNFPDDGIYMNAYNYFFENWGYQVESDEVKKVIFLYIGYTALYYGSVSKLHSGAKWDDPVEIFIHLCQFTKEYEKIIHSETVSYVEYDNFVKINQKNSKYRTREFHINKISTEYIRLIPKSIESDILSILNQHINLLKNMREEIYAYFSQNKHGCNVRRHLDRKMKPLNEHVLENIPLFGNFYFIAFLLSDTDMSSKFINLVGHDELSSVIVQTANGKSTQNAMDTAFSRCMKDFKNYTFTGKAYCCEKHGVTSKKRDMITCDEEDSLKNRIKMFGDHVDLKNVVIFE